MQKVKRATIGQKVQADVIGNGTWVYGPITEFDKDTITFDPNDGQGKVKMPRSQVYKFEVRRAVRPEPEIAKELDEAVTPSDLSPDDFDDDDEPGVDEPLIKPDLKKYSEFKEVPTKSGRPSLDINDEVAAVMRGLSLDKVYEYTYKILHSAGVEHIGRGRRKIKLTKTALRQRYQHLNPGMQRMNLGNLARGAVAVTGTTEEE